MLYIGSRFGGIGLSVVSGIGLFIQVFIFRIPMASPPVSVMLIILAVVVCASVLEAAGGMDVMLQIAEKIMRKNPQKITFIGPIVTWLMTVLLGTGHAVYSVMPIIGDVALKNGIRPERPMSASSVASQLAITASPLSAAVVYYLATLSDLDGSINLGSILFVTIPSTFAGVLALSFVRSVRGKNLDKDEEYQKRLQDPDFKELVETSSVTTLDKKLPASAHYALYIFLLAIVTVVVFAFIKPIRTIGDTKTISMGNVIQMVMLAFGGIILLVTRTKVLEVPKTKVFQSGMVAVAAIFGIAWMSNTYFAFLMPHVQESIKTVVAQAPWLFAFAMFLVSVLVNSQAATVKIMLPVAITLGIPFPVLIGLLPSCYGYFFIPNYPSDIATVNFDITQTTKIGKWYFNHSFMLPGLVGVLIACLVGLGISSILL